jgi:uncharacterized membrane protein YdbT with pleckstrin-like domain
VGQYIKEHLIADEEIVYQTKYHWIHFFTLKSLFTLGIYPLIKQWTDEFAVTNRRIVVKLGLIKRYTLEMNLSKIETVNVNQSVMGRMLDYGTIVIVGTGGTRESFPNISCPIEFRKKFQEQC